MTDLATAKDAAKASDDDLVAPSDEATTEQTDASSEVSDETPEATDDTAADESAVEPEGEPDAEPTEDDAEPTEDDAEPTDEAEPTEDDAEPVDEAEPADDAEPVDEAADDAEPTDEVEPVNEAEPLNDAEPVNEAEPLNDAEPVDEGEAVEEPEPVGAEPDEGTDDAEPADADAEDLPADGAASAEASEELSEPADVPDDSLTEVVPVDAEAALAEPDADTVVAPVVTATAAANAPAVATAPVGGDPNPPALAWAPAEPKPRKRRTGLWIALGAGAAVAALVASSLVLIAPGTTVAGVSIGGMTPAGAADAIQQRLAQTTVVLTGDGTDVEVTGAELGASVDAQALADAAFAEHPMWNPTTWYAASSDADVTLDAAAANDALRTALPDLYTDPVDATVAFDDGTAAYVVTPAVLGTGIDVTTVEAALQQAFERGSTRIELAVEPSEVDAAITTPVADETATELNGMISNVGFYIGDERTVPVDRKVAASWLTVTPDGDGFAITADADAIQPTVDGLAAAVDRPVENARVITNKAGTVLREEAAGQSGRELGDTGGIAAAFAAQLATGDATFDLPVTEIPMKTVALARSIDVNLSQQQAHLYENGNLVGSYVISSGLSDTPTPTGNFTVNGYSRIQSMGCFEGAEYCVENVPWVTWFAPDIGFHGANNLRSSLGFPQSHGCVNMWDDAAKLVYDWTAMGTEVSVHW